MTEEGEKERKKVWFVRDTETTARIIISWQGSKQGEQGEQASREELIANGWGGGAKTWVFCWDAGGVVWCVQLLVVCVQLFVVGSC